MSPANDEESLSSNEDWVEDGWVVMEDDIHAKWDKTHQAAYSPPTSSQEALATAKHTWDHLSIASLKEGLSTMAALASKEGGIVAKEAYARAPGVVGRYAGAARVYVSQVVNGGVGGVSEAGEGGCEEWEPPGKELTLSGEMGGCSSPDWGSDTAGLRAPEKARGRGANGLEYRERVGVEPEQIYRTKTRIGTTVEREDSCYDPLGVSSEWRRGQELDERNKRRKERVSEDWGKKVEKEYNQNRKYPRSDLGKEGKGGEALTQRRGGKGEGGYEGAVGGEGWEEQELRGRGEE